jgi:hypothetical protein
MEIRQKKIIEVVCICCKSISSVEVDSPLMEEAAKNSRCQVCWQREVDDKDDYEQNGWQE